MKPRGFWQGLPIAPLIEGKGVEEPRFSPTGRYLAYKKSTEDGSFLFLYDVEKNVHTQLNYENKLSTGTAYGGRTYGWGLNGKFIIFSSKGKLYRISVKGGVEESLFSFDKTFNPQMHRNGVLLVSEHEEEMSLSWLRIDKLGFFPKKFDFSKNFIYDPVGHPSRDLVAVHWWNFPHMSWDGSYISILDYSNGMDEITEIEVDGGEYATGQPKYSPNGEYLSFLSEKTGWLNLSIADADGSNPRTLVNEEYEHSYNIWVSGTSYYDWIDNERILFCRFKHGNFSLAIVNVNSGNITDLDVEKGYYHSVTSGYDGSVALLFESYNKKSQLLLLNFNEENSFTKKVISTSGVKLDGIMNDFIAPKVLEIPTKDGDKITGLLYRKGDGTAPAIINVHGGPTGSSYNKFRAFEQYYASRGWAVFNINHRGSSGHGMEFRKKLNGNWGIYDVDDCIDALEYLGEKGIIDKSKVVISGGSAGGYTTLMALARYPGKFKAGINFFGVSDLFLLADETHYLESHYMDMLVGKLPEEASKYYERSPLYMAENIEDPLLILQGEDDEVVPKNQSELIADNVKGKVETKFYKDEGHGFRKKSTIKDNFQRIDKFLKKHVLYSLD